MSLDEIDLAILKLMESILIAPVSDGVQIGCEHRERGRQLNGIRLANDYQLNNKTLHTAETRLLCTIFGRGVNGGFNGRAFTHLSLQV